MCAALPLCVCMQKKYRYRLLHIFVRTHGCVFTSILLKLSDCLPVCQLLGSVDTWIAACTSLLTLQLPLLRGQAFFCNNSVKVCKPIPCQLLGDRLHKLQWMFLSSNKCKCLHDISKYFWLCLLTFWLLSSRTQSFRLKVSLISRVETRLSQRSLMVIWLMWTGLML